jgi:metallophosphoesterase (TIGR03767 family)
LPAFDIDTQATTIKRGAANGQGWRSLEISDGEPRVGNPASSEATPLLTLLHISDLHICDAQSPARAEIMDRYADPHNPLSELVGYVGTYRPQEILTVQTLEALVQSLNKIRHGIESTRPVDAVVITGDVTDNSQQNELNWYINVLDGGEVTPDSGSSDSWEGVASTSADSYDPSYWNPEGTPAGCEEDYPRSIYGFPTIPGLTDAVRKSFTASGLRHKWLATHGNHDALLQGTVPADAFLDQFVIGDKRVQSLDPQTNIGELLSRFQMVGPAHYPSPDGTITRPIVADERRKFTKPKDWATFHLACGHDHGLTHENESAATKYWFKDIDGIRLISLDTVNINGGWQGSLDQVQFDWLKTILQDQEPKYFVVLSHHPAGDLFNDYGGSQGEVRITEREVVDLLLSEPRVILWLAGHTHVHKIVEISNEVSSFWHVQTASNVDWPQQGRLVEILEDGADIVISTSVIDHQGPVNTDTASVDLANPIALAGISRLLAANDWQRRKGPNDVELMSGEPSDRNIHLRRASK